MSIGDAFRWLREERGFTAKEVKQRVDAAFIGDKEKPPGKNQFNRIENGVLPRMKTVYKYLDGLDATERERHEFAHRAFGLKFPLGGEPRDPMILEICKYLEHMPYSYLMAMRDMFRLRGGDVDDNIGGKTVKKTVGFS